MALSIDFHMIYVAYVISDDNSRMDMDDEILQESQGDILIVYIMMVVACNTHNMFNPNELEKVATVKHHVGVTILSLHDARCAFIVQGFD